MLMWSFVHFYFVYEHLFTFQFCALMPKISKENFAQADANKANMVDKFSKMVFNCQKGQKEMLKTV